MDEVSCTGEEREFLSCPYTINHDCSVHEFVSILCKENTGNNILAFLGEEEICQLNEFIIVSVKQKLYLLVAFLFSLLVFYVVVE